MLEAFVDLTCDIWPVSGVQTIYMHDDKLVRKIPFDVRRQLIRSMKKKWDEVNKEYQLLTLSLFNLDTVSKVIGEGGKDRHRDFSRCCFLVY